MDDSEIRKTAEKLYWDFDANDSYCYSCIENIIDYLECNALNEDNKHVQFWEAVKKDIEDNQQDYI